MAGLQDFLLYQAVEQQNQTKNPLFALAEGVSRGIEEGRQRMKEKKQEEEDLALQLKFDQMQNTNSGVLNYITSPTINKKTVTRESSGKRKVVNTIISNPNYISPIEIEKNKREEAKFQQESEKRTQEIEKNKQIEIKQSESEKTFASDMLSTIKEVKDGIKYFGAAGNIPTWVSPTDYKKVNWRANFDKLVSKQVLDVMSELKKQSKTGATGFGQLSEKELAVLTNASTVLKRNMSEEDATRYLNDLENVFKKVLGTSGGNLTPRQKRIQELRAKQGEQ
jgi:hypothetical protein